MWITSQSDSGCPVSRRREIEAGEKKQMKCRTVAMQASPAKAKFQPKNGRKKDIRCKFRCTVEQSKRKGGSQGNANAGLQPEFPSIHRCVKTKGGDQHEPFLNLSDHQHSPNSHTAKRILLLRIQPPSREKKRDREGNALSSFLRRQCPESGPWGEGKREEEVGSRKHVTHHNISLDGRSQQKFSPSSGVDPIERTLTKNRTTPETPM